MLHVEVLTSPDAVPQRRESLSLAAAGADVGRDHMIERDKKVSRAQCRVVAHGASSLTVVRVGANPSFLQREEGSAPELLARDEPHQIGSSALLWLGCSNQSSAASFPTSAVA